jgi:PPOX class probable F420-dependent enzyme
MTVELTEPAKALLDTNTHVALTTIAKDGFPHSTTMWAERDGDDVIFSTVVGRAKEVHLRANDKVGISFFDAANPYPGVSIRGLATITADGGPELIQRLSKKYSGQEYTADEGTGNVRIVVRVTPTKVSS